MRLTLLSFFLTFTLTIEAQVLYIDSIKVLNLEEDKGPFATQEDEIVIINAVYSVDDDSVYSWRNSPILILNDSIALRPLDFKNQLSSKEDLYVVLAFIEVDSYFDEAYLNQLVFDTFSKYRDHPITLCKEKIRLALKDDDLLDFKLLSLEDLEKLENKITYKGMHIFNRYHYEMYFHLEE